MHFLPAVVILLAASMVLAFSGRPAGRWSGWWRIAAIAVLVVPVELFLLVLTGFVGRGYWYSYFFVYAAWLFGFGPFVFGRAIGPNAQRLAIAIVVIGGVVWLTGWPSVLRNPGWQF